ncbi:3-isopropylmalate dehydratase (small subunit) [Frankia sp. AiPs1]|uniref:3-isopropylmalate dehydratase small subunit n=1 Tax=Frankia sp. AiPa1 TaxID=573492 RepID=UPI00202B92CC|nr:3-isopropylmalate dehydratase small subunit [Frankia sp. AiPa1]MCL9758113.1 3-isopropylmalate dehydratase small subunit [Frankia sp. AiPa1]
MKPIIEHVGRAAVLRRSGVDTDQIVPAEFCKRLTKTGYDDVLFHTWRRDPDFELNDQRRAGATVLITGPDFGTGSSREHAVWALRDWGFAVVLATSFGDIFRRNALKNGLLAVALPEDVVGRLSDLAERDAALEIRTDLRRREVRAGSLTHSFDIDQRARRLLMAGLDEIDNTLDRGKAIEAYERGRAPWMPTVRPAASADVPVGGRE